MRKYWKRSMKPLAYLEIERIAPPPTCALGSWIKYDLAPFPVFIDERMVLGFF